MKNSQMQMTSWGWLRSFPPPTVQVGRTQRVPGAAAFLEKKVTEFNMN